MTGINVKSKSSRVRIAAAMILAAVMFSLVTADIYAQKPAKKIGVFVNRRDKQRTVGYTKIGLVWGQLFRPPQDLLRSIINLKEGMNRFTKIETDMDDHLELASQDLLKMPIIFIMSNDIVELTPTEREKMRERIPIHAPPPPPGAAPQHRTAEATARGRSISPGILPRKLTEKSLFEMSQCQRSPLRNERDLSLDLTAAAALALHLVLS